MLPPFIFLDFACFTCLSKLLLRFFQLLLLLVENYLLLELDLQLLSLLRVSLSDSLYLAPSLIVRVFFLSCLLILFPVFFIVASEGITLASVLIFSFFLIGPLSIAVPVVVVSPL